MKNLNDYMSFRLKTYSEEEKGEETKEEVKTEGEGETATASEEGAGEEETKTEGEGEEKSGEKSEEGELETHSVLGALFSGFLAVLFFKLRKSSEDAKGEFTFLGIAAIILALLHTLSTALNIAYRVKYGKQQDMADELQDMRAWIADIKSGKAMLTEGAKKQFVDRIEEMSKAVEEWVENNSTRPEVIDAVKDNIKITQQAAKELGIEVGMQTYSKMKVYSKADTIKAHLYLGELGWEKIGPESYLVPGTDQVVSVWTDEPTDDTMAKAQLKDGGVVTGVQQSFEDFKNFIDAVIKNGVGSYSDEDEQKDAIEVVKKREEETYSDDEIAEKAEELEKEAEELKEEAQELKEKVEGETEAKPEGETVANSECPECGQNPCVCEEKKSEGEVAANCGGFGARLMEKLNRG